MDDAASIESRERRYVLDQLLSLYGLALSGYITASFVSFFVGRDTAPDAGSARDGRPTRRYRRIA